MSPKEKCFALFMDKDEGADKPRQRWSGAVTFVLAAIGSAIGLGNFWRFPYLTYKWGGGIFFVPYLLSLFFLGLPMMLLELSLGQLFQRGDIGVFRGIHPRLYGVGLASVFSAFAINIFYTYLIAIACVYFVASIWNNPLPWSVQHTKAWQDLNCNDAGKLISDPKSDCPYLQRCEPTGENGLYITQEYFTVDLVRNYQFNEATGLCVEFDTKESIGGEVAGQVNEFSWQILLALLFTWMVTYFCVWKGVKSSSYVVWFTVPGPIIFIFIMVLNGLCLENADEGIRMYLMGEIDGVIPAASEKLSDGQMWADACGQIFFSLGVCMGVMTSYSSYNARNKPIIRDVMIISFGNCMLSFFAGFAVFSIVGYLKGIGSPVQDKTSSSGLAFVAYPAAAETMEGSNWWCFLLGLTLFTLGIDTAFSLVEAVSTVIYDTETGKTVPRKLTALIISVLGWAFSLLFCSSWGFTYFDVVDRYISVYLMFILGIMQCAAAGWFFRASEVMAPGSSTRNGAMIISIVYWVMVLIMGPVTVFALKPAGFAWLGIVIFWVVVLAAIIVSMAIKGSMDAKKWYQEVCFFGAYELSNELCKRSNYNTGENCQWWMPIFTFWWSFSIKYFIPWALWTLMMWNFQGDITMDEFGRGYGSYHTFWQLMGFVYPFIGLLVFIIPVCICTEHEKGQPDRITFDKEEHKELQEQQEKLQKALRDTENARSGKN